MKNQQMKAYLLVTQIQVYSFWYQLNHFICVLELKDVAYKGYDSRLVYLRAGTLYTPSRFVKTQKRSDSMNLLSHSNVILFKLKIELHQLRKLLPLKIGINRNEQQRTTFAPNPIHFAIVTVIYNLRYSRQVYACQLALLSISLYSIELAKHLASKQQR